MRTYALLLLLVLLPAGCSVVEVDSQTLVAGALTETKSYTWLGLTGASEDARVRDPQVASLVQRAVEREMAALGYTQVNEGGDVLVSWFGTVANRVKHQDISHFYGRYGYGSAIAAKMPAETASQAVKTEYREGTLLVDVLAGDTGQLVWRGAATNTIAGTLSAKEKAAYINSSVRAIFAEFPKGK